MVCSHKEPPAKTMAINHNITSNITPFNKWSYGGFSDPRWVQEWRSTWQSWPKAVHSPRVRHAPCHQAAYQSQLRARNQTPRNRVWDRPVFYEMSYKQNTILGPEKIPENTKEREINKTKRIIPQTWWRWWQCSQESLQSVVLILLGKETES